MPRFFIDGEALCDNTVIIEGEDPEFTIINDYEVDIEEWLLKRMKERYLKEY